jgi:hypothetical protein
VYYSEILSSTLPTTENIKKSNTYELEAPGTISAIVTEDAKLRHAVQEHAASRMSRYAVIAFIVA